MEASVIQLIDLARRMDEAEKGLDIAFFEALRNPVHAYDLLESTDITATTYEDVAVFSLIVRAAGSREGKPFS